MIKKLKLKFIVLALSALFVLLSVIVGGMNLLNYNAVVKEADNILLLLSQNKGAFPPPPNDKNDWLPPGMSPEIPYETRFFSVVVNNRGEVIHTETSRVSAIDGKTASQYAQTVVQHGNNQGFVGNYRYISSPEMNGVRITFLDCGRKLDLFHNFAVFSVGMSLLGYVITAIAICFFAGKFIRPVAESYEKQKQFITDAGHELKTPLTIINANVDLLSIDMGENECLEDVRQQTKRLTTLTNNLIYLARMEEAGNSLQMIEFPVSEIIFDAATPFQTLAQIQKKELSLQVQPMLSLRGNDNTISQLVSILLDNALKYSPEGSHISLSFEKQGRKLILSVTNLSVMPITDENLRHVFDRFYRADSSHNSETGGHGIGLSMANTIVAAHNGKISASSRDGRLFTVTAIFPI